MDAALITSIGSSIVTVLVLSAGFGLVLQRLTTVETGQGDLRTEVRGLRADLGDLRVEVAQIGQRLDDHVMDACAHS